MDSYRRSYKGMLSRMYYYMQRRVAGETNKAHIYKGLRLTGRKRFYGFALQNRTLKRLYSIWKSSGHQLSDRPTPHRINRKRGYDVGNIKFVSYRSNSKKIIRKKN